MSAVPHAPLFSPQAIRIIYGGQVNSKNAPTFAVRTRALVLTRSPNAAKGSVIFRPMLKGPH